MLMTTERHQIVKYGKKLVTTNLTNGTGGNLSMINREKEMIAISPSGMDYFETTPEDIVITDLNGNIIEGHNKPSSEFNFHLALYDHKPQINAVVHTHSVYATTLACLGWELPAVHYMVAFSGNKVPVATYETFGTEALANAIIEGIEDYNAILLANHGLITTANNIETAFAAAEEIEFTARVYYQSKSIGEPVILNDQQMNVVIEKFKTYGQK